MKLGQFISTSAVILLGWLGFTFIHEVPSQRYPKLQRYTEAKPRLISPDSAEPEVFHVSISQ